jgi:hypothetical protein
LLWKLLLLVAREALATLVARPVAALAVQALGVVLGQWAPPEQNLGPLL